METTSVNGRPVAPPSSPLVSRSAILILSSVAIGTALGRRQFTGLDFCCFCAGLAGLISFLALDYVASRRRRRLVRRTLEEARQDLDARIKRLVAPAAGAATASPHRRRRRDESSYLTVTVA